LAITSSLASEGVYTDDRHQPTADDRDASNNLEAGDSPSEMLGRTASLSFPSTMRSGSSPVQAEKDFDNDTQAPT
jgi:hypothetical protein